MRPIRHLLPCVLLACGGTSDQPDGGPDGSGHADAGKDGTTHTLSAGSPTLERLGVKAYHVKEILLAPDNVSLVFLIQRQEQDTDGDNVRYMVETLRMK